MVIPHSHLSGSNVFRDMADQTLYKFHDWDGLFHIIQAKV